MQKKQLHLKTTQEAVQFVSLLNSEDNNDEYVLENENGNYRADARSLLGVLYFISEHEDEMFLINYTNDGIFPQWL